MGQANPPTYCRVGVDRQTNPSICGEDVLIREVNYDLSEGFVRPPDTKNYLGRLQGRTVENLNLLDDNPRSLIFRNGLEDGRLIRFNGRLYGLFSGHYQSEGRWVVYRNTMVLWDFENGSYRTYPTKSREKNWMPFVENGRLFAVSSTSPLVIVDLDDGSIVKEGPGLTEKWSGGSQLIPYQGGYLGVVHRHTTDESLPPGFNRVYDHAFILMNGYSLELSPPFRFFGERVEFCAGISQYEGSLCLSFGVMDKEGYLAWVGLEGSPQKS